MNTKLTPELIASISADPIVRCYLKLSNDDSGQERPIFVDARLQSAFFEVHNEVEKLHVHLFSTLRLYKCLLLFYYSDKYKSMSELREVMHCFSEAKITAALGNVHETITIWHNYIKRDMIHFLYKEAFMQIMLEWTRRYQFLNGCIDQNELELNSKKVVALLFWNEKYLGLWQPELMELLRKKVLHRKLKGYKSLKSNPLSNLQIIYDIEKRLSPLVHKFVLNCLQLERNIALPRYNCGNTNAENNYSKGLNKESNNDASFTSSVADNTIFKVFNTDTINVSFDEGSEDSENIANVQTPSNSMKYNYSDYHRIQYKPRSICLNILHATNQNINVSAVAKIFDVSVAEVKLILRFRQEILNEWKYNANPSIRLSHLEIEYLVSFNEVLKEWCRRTLLMNITDELIIAKAQSLKKIFALDFFEVSPRWLNLFKAHLNSIKNKSFVERTSLDILEIVEDLRWILPAPGYALFKLCLTNESTIDLPKYIKHKGDILVVSNEPSDLGKPRKTYKRKAIAESSVKSTGIDFRKSAQHKTAISSVKSTGIVFQKSANHQTAIFTNGPLSKNQNIKVVLSDEPLVFRKPTKTYERKATANSIANITDVVKQHNNEYDENEITLQSQDDPSACTISVDMPNLVARPEKRRRTSSAMRIANKNSRVHITKQQYDKDLVLSNQPALTKPSKLWERKISEVSAEITTNGVNHDIKKVTQQEQEAHKESQENVDLNYLATFSIRTEDEIKIEDNGQDMPISLRAEQSIIQFFQPLIKTECVDVVNCGTEGDQTTVKIEPAEPYESRDRINNIQTAGNTNFVWIPYAMVKTELPSGLEEFAVEQKRLSIKYDAKTSHT